MALGLCFGLRLVEDFISNNVCFIPWKENQWRYALAVILTIEWI
ncbi:hypothetical protein CSC04_2712 [Enterobacter roggenkampii]|nr:hypothetical protein CSC04_2712 [Enterobacter roggenkampii]QLC83056.1 hypothetical protein ED5_2405 [Enterobacter roggenkampii]